MVALHKSKVTMVACLRDDGRTYFLTKYVARMTKLAVSTAKHSPNMAKVYTRLKVVSKPSDFHVSVTHVDVKLAYLYIFSMTRTDGEKINYVTTTIVIMDFKLNFSAPTLTHELIAYL